MGVLGLWTLLDPVGKPVPVESLSHKVLAVDVSIWLNQAVRGFRDKQGNGVANAHLLGLYHRVCKLLFYKIRPVFVFDGAPPALKRETLARRRMKRSREAKNAKVASEKILSNYIQRQAVAQRLNRQTHAVENALKRGTSGLHQMIRGHGCRDKDIFELPEMPPKDEEDVIISSDDSDSETDLILEQVGLKNVHDVYQVDVESEQFVNLPKNIQYEVLNDLKGKKKQNSWAKMHEMPRKAEEFSGFQMERLKRRRKIDAKLDNVREDLSKNQMEMMDSKLFVGDKMGLKKLKTETRRMASRPDAGVVFMSGLSQENRDSEEEKDPEPGTSASVVRPSEKLAKRSKDLDEHIDAAIALSLTSDVGPTQEDIYNMIKRENKETTAPIPIDSGAEEDSDVIILIPPPSEFQSSRAGGLGLLKQESPEVTIKEEVVEVPEEFCVKGVDEVSVMMSDSDSDSSDGGFVDVDDEGEHVEEKEEEEDLFADVFKEKENINMLDSIVKDAKLLKDGEQLQTIVTDDPPRSNPDAENLLERISHLDKPSDIFADIAARAKCKPRPVISNASVRSILPSKSSEKDCEVSKSTFSREVSDNLKNGPGIMMKIASKWADAEAKDAESDESDIDNPGCVNDEEEVKDAFDLEQERLVREMNEVQKENRLLRFTQDVTNHQLVTKSKGIQGDKFALKVSSSNEENLKSTTNSLLEAGSSRESSASDGKIYMAPAAGFVPAGRDLNPEKIVIQRDEGDDADEWGPGDLCPPPSQEEGLQTHDLLQLQEQLAAEQNTLVAEMGKANRLSNSITDQMYADCQELLQLFGLPWVVAPGEAEAQCAFLDSAGLTEGTITDDSDIWLFGGSRVYKNFFDQEKYVEFFNGSEIVTHFGLNRDKLVNLALLTGSDYTEGVETVGAVTAMEVLAEFPGDGLGPLEDFKVWSERVAPEIGMPVGNKTREKLRKLKLPPSFPSQAVVSAYLRPSVDESRESFTWAVPNLVAVRDFARERFGWDREKIDRLLTPVVRALDSRRDSRQATLETFFTSSRVKLPDKGLVSTSKRVEEAIRKVRGIRSPEKIKLDTTVRRKNKSNPAIKPKKTASATVDIKPGSTTMHKPSAEVGKEIEVSLIAKSCGIVIAPSKDDVILQKLEREKKAKEAKEKAAEIFKKSQKAKQNKIQKKFKRPKRIELSDGHGLSESDSD